MVFIGSSGEGSEWKSRLLNHRAIGRTLDDHVDGGWREAVVIDGFEKSLFQIAHVGAEIGLACGSVGNKQPVRIAHILRKVNLVKPIGDPIRHSQGHNRVGHGYFETWRGLAESRDTGIHGAHCQTGKTGEAHKLLPIIFQRFHPIPFSWRYSAIGSQHLFHRLADKSISPLGQRLSKASF